MKQWNDGSTSLVVSWCAVVIFFAACVLFPLLCVAFTPSAGDFVTVFTNERWHRAMANTVLECIASTGMSVLFGFVYAYAVERGNIPFRRFFAAVPVAHLVTPPFVGGLAFILLLGRQGFVTKTMLGLDVSLYGFWGLLIAQTLCFFPMAYLICRQALQGINPTLEQAARSMGSGRFRIFTTITLPLSVPGIVSATLFIAVSVLSDFGNPLIVSGRFRVLAVEIYTQLTGWLNAGTSAVLGLVLVIPSVILFLVQNHLLKKNGVKIATIGGKSQSFQSLSPSRSVTVFLTIFVFLVSLAIIAQIFAIIAGSFQKLWGINTAFTLDHLKAMGLYVRELSNTLFFAFVSALLSTFIACLTTYLVHRTDAPLSRTLDSVSQLPSAIPGSLYGLALSVAAARLRLNASGFLIVVAMTAGFLPFSYRILSSSLAQLKTTLDDGARSLGANRMKVLSSILAPLSSGSLFYAFVYNFVRGVGTVSAVIFLVSFSTPLASVKILNLAEQGDWGKAACLALILTLITFIILTAGKLISQRYQKRIWSIH